MIRKSLLVASLLYLSGFTFPVTARDWFSYSSDNFTVYSDLNPR